MNYLGDSNKIILIRVSEKPLKWTEDSSDRISTPLLGIKSLHTYIQHTAEDSGFIARIMMRRK